MKELNLALLLLLFLLFLSFRCRFVEIFQDSQNSNFNVKYSLFNFTHYRALK